MKRTHILSILLIFTAQWTWANTISYTDRERQIHDHYVSQVSVDAAACLQDTWDEHIAFYNRYGVSKFFGDRNQNLNTRAERLSALQAYGKSTSLIDELEPTSCIGLTLECMGQAFTRTRNDEAIALWQKVEGFVKANGVSGVHLINALQGLGWKVLYWNPAPGNNARWDAEDPRLTRGKPVSWNSPVKDNQGRSIYNPAWGMHADRYSSVMNRDMYYLTRVDDKELLVDFGTTVPQAFQRAPFFVGVAHAGYHVFPGFYGQVIEAHSTRALNSGDNLEKSMFNPLATGGGPRWTRVEKYRSGIVAVPPNTVP